MAVWSIVRFNVLSNNKIGVSFADALTWPGGIDLAPDSMYQRIRESGISTRNPLRLGRSRVRGL